MNWAYSELNDGSPKKIQAQEDRVTKRRKALERRLARGKITIDTEGLPNGTTVAFGPGVTTKKPHGRDAYDLPVVTS